MFDGNGFISVEDAEAIRNLMVFMMKERKAAVEEAEEDDRIYTKAERKNYGLSSESGDKKPKKKPSKEWPDVVGDTSSNAVEEVEYEEVPDPELQTAAIKVFREESKKRCIPVYISFILIDPERYKFKGKFAEVTFTEEDSFLVDTGGFYM